MHQKFYEWPVPRTSKNISSYVPIKLNTMKEPSFRLVLHFPYQSRSSCPPQKKKTESDGIFKLGNFEEV